MSYHVFLFHLVNDSLKNIILFNVASHHICEYFHFHEFEHNLTLESLTINFLIIQLKMQGSLLFRENTTAVIPTGSSSFHRSALSPPPLSLHPSFFFSFSLSQSLFLALYRVTRCVAAHAIFAVEREGFSTTPTHTVRSHPVAEFIDP
jgi:hypothetical protein